MYLQYALPGAADPQLQQPSTAYDRPSGHLNYGASPVYQPRAAFEATPSAYNEIDSSKILKVSSPDPQRGTKGTLLYIQLDSSSELLSPSATLMFATRSVPAGLTQLDPREQDVSYRYLISAIAPAFSETGSSNMNIPLSLQLQQLQERSRLDTRLIDVGPWQYEDGKQLEHRSFPQEFSRKRKLTDDPSDAPRSAKFATPSEHRIAQSQEYGSYAYPSASLGYPQSLQNVVNTMDRKYTAYGRSQLQNLQAESNTMAPQGTIGCASTSQSLMRPPLNQTSSWTSSYVTGYQPGRNPQLNAAPSLQVSSISAPGSTNPTLVRSTTLAPQPSPSKSAGSSSDGSFNPYTLYSNRAVLEIRGDLNAVQENWTLEERAAKRRIVRFWREQNGTTLNAYFKPVRADEQLLPNETYERRISCIYWEERDEYYVTSVDTISLLESLVAAKFGVEEKNRIRRNLEGYKPCTVSKSKPESESFFKLVMGFPSPKPRNIEKDVKAFNWPILEQALKKIISKYVQSFPLAPDSFHTDLYQSADPASITGSLERQRSSTFGGSQSKAGAGRYSALSSRSTSGSTASGAYAQTLKSSTLSPPTASYGLSSYSQASPLQQFSTPSLSHSYNMSTPGSQYIPTDPSNSPYAVQGSMPNLSPAYTDSTIGRRRSSETPTDNPFASIPNQYSKPSRSSTSFPSPYIPLESNEATATLGLPGRASVDLSAYLNTDAASFGSIGDAQYRRHSSVKDEAGVTRFKEE